MTISNTPMLALAFVFAMAQATPSVAAPSVRSACKPEISQMCSAEYAARDRNKVRDCLVTNIEKVSAECRAAIEAQMAANKK